MENFTAVDGGAALVIILSAILAYSRGLVRELMAIVGWIGAAVVAFLFAPSAMPLVKEVPMVGEFLNDSCELSVIVAFAGVFAIGLIVMALFTPLFASVIQRSALGGIDQALGFVFGVARGGLHRLGPGAVEPVGADDRQFPHRQGLRQFPGLDRRLDPVGRAGLDRGALQRPDHGLHPRGRHPHS